MNNDYKGYVKLYTIKEEYKNIIYSTELDYNKMLLLTTDNNLKLVSISKNNNTFKDKKEIINNLLIDQDKTLISLKKISKNVISLNLINRENESANVSKTEIFSISNLSDMNQMEKDFHINDTINVDNFDELFISFKKENNDEEETFLSKNHEKYIKLISINIDNNGKNKNTIEDKSDSLLDIKNQYTLPKNYQLLGNISEEDNIFLFNYNYLFFIFDFNICQFTYIFNCHNISTDPKYFVKYNYDFINNKEGFVIINEDFSFTQYFYDKLYANKIYYINKVTIDQKTNNSLNFIFSLKNKFIAFCNNNDYYMLNSK